MMKAFEPTATRRDARPLHPYPAPAGAIAHRVYHLRDTGPSGSRQVATWLDLEPPFLAELPAPAGLDFADFYSVFIFASGATIEFNGRHVDGRPYTEVIPPTHIGGERSSCMFALSETMVLCAPGATPVAHADR